MSSTPIAPAALGAAGPFNDQVLDTETLARLDQLAPSGSPSVAERVLVTYGRALDKALGELDSAWKAGDWKTLEREAHTLRSSSAIVGALHLSKLCRALEDALRDSRTGSLAPCVQALALETQRVKAAVDEHLLAKGCVA